MRTSSFDNEDDSCGRILKKYFNSFVYASADYYFIFCLLSFIMFTVEDVYQECTLFGCISYLGSAAINAPKSKTEILRNMIILNEQQSSSEQAIKISVSVPNSLDGVVV